MEWISIGRVTKTHGLKGDLKFYPSINETWVTKIKQIPTTTGGTTFEYLDANGDLIHSTTTTRTPVKLSKKGIATTLTKTREVTL